MNENNQEHYLEHCKAELQDWVNEKQHARQNDIEMFRSTLAAGQNALKAALILNGGASLAILTFIGKLIDEKPELASSFAESLLCFAIGSLSVVIASGFNYVTQWFYTNGSSNIGHAINFLSIAACIIGYVLFFWGLHEAYSVFKDCSDLKAC